MRFSYEGERMNITDFETECGQGLCACSEIDGQEFVLSQVFEGGVYEVKDTVDKIVHEVKTVATIGYRFMVIQRMLQLEVDSGMSCNDTRQCLERDYHISKNLSAQQADMAFSLCLSLAQLTMKEE